ncbi:hypothetical protein HAX54_036506, partial [Datura stramonium]|nr:hypothetical protein [Datura stramonium]
VAPLQALHSSNDLGTMAPNADKSKGMATLSKGVKQERKGEAANSGTESSTGKKI